jgi:hypothetical protein
MQTVPLWLQGAFADWIANRIYVDGRGNYRSRVLHRRIVRYNRALKRLYPQNEDFRRASHMWLALWDAVPTAKLTQTERQS